MEYEIIDRNDQVTTIRCATCGRIHRYSTANVHKFHHSAVGYCGRALHAEVAERYGKPIERKFFAIMRTAKNRVCNSRNKDHALYGRLSWGFTDSFHFASLELLPFVEAAQKYGLRNISIDRIDGRSGYVPGNIRWVPMADNLRNRQCVKAVQCLDLQTGSLTIWPSCQACGDALGIDNSRIWDCCNREHNHTYKGLYQFCYA